MKHSTNHCDLCGAAIVCGRSNSYEGNLQLKLKPIGNFFTEDEELEVCNSCGGSICKHIALLKKKFTVKTNVEVLDEIPID